MKDGNAREVGGWWSLRYFRFMSRGEALRFVTASLAKWLKYWASSAAICNDLFQQKAQAVQRQRVASLVNPALSYCRAGITKLKPQAVQTNWWKWNSEDQHQPHASMMSDSRQTPKKHTECPTNGRLELLWIYILRFLSVCCSKMCEEGMCVI